MMELYDRKSQTISIAKVGRSRKYSHFFGGRLDDYGFKEKVIVRFILYGCWMLQIRFA